MIFTCVKPVSGFGTGRLVSCGDVAAFQSATHAGLKWCAAHVATDTGYSGNWIPVDCDRARAMQAEDERLHARYLAALAARPRVATRAPIVHTFDSTRAAYDASQCDDSIADGDVLHVPSEGVTGFLYKAWPIALTVKHGAFHLFAETPDYACVNGDSMDYRASVALAQSLMERSANV